jgi:hypothetical protein
LCVPALPVSCAWLQAEGVIPAQQDEELGALRARLYRPGATADDLRRYEAALALPEAEEPDAPTAPARPRSRRRRVLVAVAAAGLLVAGVPTARWLGASSPSPAATPAPAALEWYPDGPVRTVRLTGDPEVQQFQGRGAGTAALQSDRLPSSEGRLEVVLTVAGSAPVRWTATRVDEGPGSIVTLRVLGERSAPQTGGVPVPVAFFYAGGPPTAVHVQVPEGLGWSLVVQPRT